MASPSHQKPVRETQTMERIRQKLWKSADHNQISSKDGQDTQACKNRRPFVPYIPQKMSENTKLTFFTKSKCHQNKEDEEAVTKI